MLTAFGLEVAGLLPTTVGNEKEAGGPVMVTAGEVTPGRTLVLKKMHSKMITLIAGHSNWISYGNFWR